MIKTLIIIGYNDNIVIIGSKYECSITIFTLIFFAFDILF